MGRAPDASRSWKHHAPWIHLLVVIIVISIIAAVAVPKMTQHGIRGKEAGLRATLKVYRGSIVRFHLDTGAFPATLNALHKTSTPAFGID